MKRSRISAFTSQSIKPLIEKNETIQKIEDNPVEDNPIQKIQEPQLISELPKYTGEVEPQTETNLSESIICEKIESIQNIFPVLYQSDAVDKLVKIFQMPYFCVIVQGPSGHGKSKVIEAARKKAGFLDEFISDSHIVGDSSTTFKELFSLSLNQSASLKKCKGVLIDNIEGLDTEIKKNLSLFLKKESSKCRLILTTDSLQETPSKTIKGYSNVSVIALKIQDTLQIQTIVQKYALTKYNWSVPLDKLLDLSEASNRCPRAALTLFDFVAQTKKAKSNKNSHSTKSFRDSTYDLFSQVPSVAKGKPQKFTLQSSDLVFANQVLFENTTKHRDHFSNQDIYSKDFLFDTESMQCLLEAPFKADPNPMQAYTRMSMPKSLKPKLIEQAAWIDRGDPVATEKGVSQDFHCIGQRMYGMDAYQSLDLIRRLVKQSNFKGRWTAKHYGYDVNEDIRNLRNPDKPIFA